MTSACAICDKHRGVGPLVGPRVFADDLVVVSHRPPLPGEQAAVPGYLFIETRRHVRSLSQLEEHEAAAVASAAWRAARALECELAPAFVFSAIAGRSAPHFHQHVFVRPAGTPDAVPWNDTDAWGERPLLGEQNQ
ncbi:HIT domain-containing protein [Rhodococcus phenolicus]|uniref:HIT domain-containing protein n=1 Tax=Rhodococcus phenolicus TaxID=263849 RepID=UPI0009ED8BE4|nr:HIT domain-containing protein [Rhodococcus phenolicus]